MTRMRKVNIPLFIPHEGCPHACVFCDQKTITGKSEAADRDIAFEIENALSTVEMDAECEIAFFGGSFTGIERGTMVRLLSDASSYVESGRVASIRISTRPDYIDDEILSILKHYGVRHIELGIQSTDERVLRAAGRGHTVRDTERACEKIVSAGFVLGGQMMLGLPLSTAESERKTARDIVRMGAREARLYPTAVFPDTPLYKMALRGEYIPLTLSDATERAADCYEIFLDGGVRLLRVGLYSGSTNGKTKQPILGITHPAFGELCAGEVYRRRLIKSLSALSLPHGAFALKITCPRGDISKLGGQKGCNKKELFRLCRERGAELSRILWEEKDGLSPFSFSLSTVAENEKNDKIFKPTRRK